MSIVFKPRSLNVSIRWMLRTDSPEVMATESSLPDAWSDEQMLKLLRQRNAIGMVAVEKSLDPKFEDQVVGHMIYSLHREFIFLERIAVAPEKRGRGVFRRLNQKLLSKLSPERRTRVEAVVDERNLDLLLAMRACGWEATDLIRGRFDDADGIHLRLGMDAAVQR